MANWYVSSVAYTAVAQFAISHAYSLGDIVRQLAAPATNLERCFRCTTAGTSGGSESAWNTGSNATTTQGTAVFTECTGQEAHQHDNGVTNTWTAPAARVNCLTAASNGKNTFAAGDTIFISSDHAETQSTALTLSILGTVASPGRAISVSRTSSNLPPLSAQITSGASIACTGGNFFTNAAGREFYWNGITFDGSANTTGAAPVVGSNDNRFIDSFENCTIKSSNTSSASLFAQVQGHAVWKNCTLSLTHASSLFRMQTTSSLVWQGGSTTGSGTSLFDSCQSLVMEGVDLSSITGTIFQPAGSETFFPARVWGCKLAASPVHVSGLGDSNTLTNNTTFAAEYFANLDADMINMQFIACENGADNYNDHVFKWAGYYQSETTITLSGGGQTGTQNLAYKMVSNNNASKIWPLYLDLYAYNDVTGVSKTATVELISSTTLNNDDIWGELHYFGSSSNAQLSIAKNTVADPLASNAAQTSSTATWNSSPATPQKQKLQITFTPQQKGEVRMRVCLAKTGQTVYVDPVLQVA